MRNRICRRFLRSLGIVGMSWRPYFSMRGHCASDYESDARCKPISQVSHVDGVARIRAVTRMGVPWWLDIGLGMPGFTSKMRRVHGMFHLADVAATRSGL